MRALLINPWIYDFAAYDLWSKPLGLLNIASYLKNLGFEISLIDCLDRFNPELVKFLGGKLPKSTPYGSGFYYSEIIEKPPLFKNLKRHFKRYGLPKELFRKIISKENKPDIILVSSGMTYWYLGVFEAIKILKERFPDSPILLGGVYATLCSEHSKKFSGADFIYKGNDINEILKAVASLTRTKLGDSIFENKKEFFPSYDLYSTLPYVTLRTSSGCPFKCSYCGWYLLEKEFAQAKSEFIVDEIEYFYKNYGVQNFSFYDDALLYKAEKHIVKVLEGVLKKDIKANFHTPNGLHARFISRDLAKLFKTSGFIQPRIGFETADTKRQIESGAKTTNEEFLRAIEHLEKAGYQSNEIAVYMLMGLPNQPEGEIRRSIELAASKKVRIFLEEYSPIPNTPYYKESGLPLDADPLLHNNSAFPLYRREECNKFQSLKNLANSLNNKLKFRP